MVEFFQKHDLKLFTYWDIRKAFSFSLDADDRDRINAVSRQSRDLYQLIDDNFEELDDNTVKVTVETTAVSHAPKLHFRPQSTANF
ncbi:MAG: hypothetical protein V7L26_17900 [Nostoc sp.]|uniref:hypothetical protein n=1 Tax=Nostoc sp. TaxID=1180 RepID=UPI002FF78931